MFYFRRKRDTSAVNILFLITNSLSVVNVKPYKIIDICPLFNNLLRNIGLIIWNVYQN